MGITSGQTNSAFNGLNKAERLVYPDNESDLNQRIIKASSGIEEVLKKHQSMRQVVIDLFNKGNTAEKLIKDATENEELVLDKLGYDVAEIIAGLKLLEDKGLKVFEDSIS